MSTNTGKILAVIYMILMVLDGPRAFIGDIENQSNDTFTRICCYANDTSSLDWFIDNQEVRCPPEDNEVEYFIIPCVGITDTRDTGGIIESCRTFSTDLLDMSRMFRAQCCEPIVGNPQCRSIDVDLHMQPVATTTASTAGAIVDEHQPHQAFTGISIAAFALSVINLLITVIMGVMICYIIKMLTKKTNLEKLHGSHRTEQAELKSYEKNDELQSSDKNSDLQSNTTMGDSEEALDYPEIS